MKTSTRIFLFFCWLIPAIGFSQQSLRLRLKLIDSKTWGVYVRPMDNISPSPNTITTVAQVTVVMPKQYEWDSLKNVHGTWGQSTVHGPTENPTRSYVSFYLITDVPQIPFVAGQESLLFTFKKKSFLVPCPDSLYLMDNANDPFNQLPNSQGSNPGMAFSVFDIIHSYEYDSNYALSGWSCNDNDGDHYPNGMEDTNGDGDFDPGVDASDLNVIENGLDFKLQLIEENKWGVFVRPMDNLNPSLNTQVAAAYVTVVMPKDYAWNSLVSVHGTWAGNAWVNGPIENPSREYVSFGWITEFPHVDLVSGQETLLFTFKTQGPCPDSIYLINNTNDPFLPPNSQNANVGNDMAVYDPIGAIYVYRKNYSPSAWSCHDNDGDGILNAFEDTDGDGQYDANNEDTNGNGLLDPGEDDDGDGYLDPDASDLNDPCSFGQPVLATLSAVNGTEVICANDLGDIAYVKVDITGGTPPFEISYTDGQDTFFVYNYHAGDSIPVVPSQSVQLQLVSVTDSFGCSQNTVLEGVVNIGVQGPIAFDNQPDTVVECAGNGTNFCVTTLNLGEGVLNYQWQVNDGSGWTDLSESGTYSQTTTSCLFIGNVAGLHGNQYRCWISTSECDAIYSNAALLEVEGPLAFTAHPQDAVNCASENVTFTASFGNGGTVGTMTYVWQYSQDGVDWLDLSNGVGPAGAVFGGATGSTAAQNGSSTLTVTNISNILDGDHFRIKVSTLECNQVFSNPARLNVEGPVSIIDQPNDTIICNGSDVEFVSGFQNAGGNYPADQNLTLTNYFWQVSSNGGATWSNLTNTYGVYTGISGVNVGGYGSDTLNITNTSGLDGYKYRIAYTTPTCAVPVYSDAATLQTNVNVTFTDHPDDIVICDGSDTILVAAASTVAGSFNFDWEYSIDYGTTWQPMDFVADAAIFSHSNQGQVNAGADTLTIHNSAGMYNRFFRAVAHISNCTAVYSDYAILTLHGPLSVLDQPDDVIECSGNNTTFSAKVENQGGLGSTIVHWQASVDNGLTWHNLNNNALYNGANSINPTTGVSVLLVSNVANLHNRLYRLSYRTSTCPIQYTNPARLTVEGSLTITHHPQDADVCSDGSASFTSSASVGTAGTPVYQWQISTDGLNYSDIDSLTDGGVYTNFDTPTLGVSNTNGLESRRYRMSVRTAECNRIFSQPARLNMENQVILLQQPTNVATCSGESILFSVSVVNDLPCYPPQYQWQESPDNGLTWVDLVNDTMYNGVLTESLAIAYSNNFNNYCYRARIWKSSFDTVYSAVACVNVDGPITVLDEPDDITGCSDISGTMQAVVHIDNADQSTLIYQWEVSNYDSTIGYLTWENITNNGLYSGATTPTLQITDLGLVNKSRFRLRFRTSICSSNWTNYAQVDVYSPFAISGQPVSMTTCQDGTASFQANAVLNNGSSDTLQYQWQISSDGVNFTDIIDAGSNGFSGMNSTHLTIGHAAGLNNTKFRLVAWVGNCFPKYSQAATLTVGDELLFTVLPQNNDFCSDATALLKAAFAYCGQSTVNHAWEMSANGMDWEPILQTLDTINGHVVEFSGFGTDSLFIHSLTGLNNFKFRRRVWTSDGLNDEYSNAATLTVEGPLSFIDQPDDVSVCSGGSQVCFTVVVENAGAGTVQYKWQLAGASGVWTNFSSNNTGPYSGALTNQLCISNVTTSYHNYSYRCLVKTPHCTWLYSDAAKITVQGPIMVNLQPQSASVCSNKSYLFNTTIANPGSGQMTYRWQYSADNGLFWVDFPSNIGPLANLGIVNPTDPTAVYQGAFTPDLYLSNVDGLDGWKFRLVITTSLCTVTTNEVALTVLDACQDGTCDLDNDGLPNDQDPDDDNDQVSDYLEEWMTQANIADGWNYTDSNGLPLFFDPCKPDSDGDGIYDNQEDPDGDLINTGEETDGDLTFDGNPLDPNDPLPQGISISQQPQATVTICSNKPIQFNTTVGSPEPANTNYQWQRSTDGGATWSNFLTDEGSNFPYNYGQFQGAHTDDLSFTLTEGMDGHRFRLIVTLGQDADTSIVSTLYVPDACDNLDCDIDLDGTINEVDPDFNNCGNACLKIKLQLLPDSSGWAVMAKPFGSYVPTPGAVTTAGRITLAVPTDFVLDGFSSLAGTWSPTNVADNVPGYPGRKFVTFEMLDSLGAQIPYTANQSISLFSFAKTGPCPDSMYIVENFPTGITPNELFGENNGAAGSFELCGVYARKNWNCHPPSGGGPIIVVPFGSISAPQAETEGRGASSDTDHTVKFTASPNPAGDFVNIALEGNLAKGNHTISLWDLQGKQRQTLDLEEKTTAQFDLRNLAAGIYLVVLTQNGRVVQREKLVVR